SRGHRCCCLTFRWHPCCAISPGWQRSGGRRDRDGMRDLMGMAGALLDGKTYVAAALRRLHLGAGLMALVATPAFAFDFARYQAADFDDILAQPRPQTGLDLNGAKPLRAAMSC